MTQKGKRSRSEEKFRQSYIKECKDMIQEITKNIAYHERTIGFYKKDLKDYEDRLEEAEIEQ